MPKEEGYTKKKLPLFGGFLGKAQEALSGRGKKIDEAVEEAVSGKKKKKKDKK